MTLGKLMARLAITVAVALALLAATIIALDIYSWLELIKTVERL